MDLSTKLKSFYDNASEEVFSASSVVGAGNAATFPSKMFLEKIGLFSAKFRQY